MMTGLGKRYFLAVLFFFILMEKNSLMAQIPSYIPTQGLVGWWPLDGNAIDATGNGLNGIVNGAIPTFDRYGAANSAYQFDGMNDFIQVAHQSILSINSSFTVSAWIRPASIPPSNLIVKGIVAKGSWGEAHGGDHNYWLTLHNHSGWASQPSFGVGYENSSATNFIQGSIINTSFLDNWHLLVGVYDQALQKLTLYVNNVEMGSNLSASGTPNTSNQPLLFGAFYSNPASVQSNSFFHGDIDDIGLWNRALNSEEISNLFIECQLGFMTQPQAQTAFEGQQAEFIAHSSDPTVTYQWQQFNGAVFVNLTNSGQFSGVTTDTLVISNVTLQNHNQFFRCKIFRATCEDSSMSAVLNVVPIGINEVGFFNSVDAIPNPSFGVIEIRGLKESSFSYQIIDMNGRMVKSGTQVERYLHFREISKGMYILRISQDSAIYHQRILLE